MSIATLVHFNINDDVRVRVTKMGRAVWEAHWAEVLKGSRLEAPELKMDEDGYTLFQLWDLMHIFGPQLYMGNAGHPLFEHNEIEFPVTIAISSA